MNETITILPPSRKDSIMALLVGVALGGIGFLNDPRNAAEYLLSWFSIVLSAMMVGTFVRQLVVPPAPATLDDAGVELPPLKVGRIPWSDIDGATVGRRLGYPFIALTLREPTRWTARLPLGRRLLAPLNRLMGIGPFELRLTKRNDPREIVRFVEQHAANVTQPLWGVNPAGLTPSMSGVAVEQDRISGWLLVFVVTEVITCCLAIGNVIAAPASFTAEGRNLQAAVPMYLVYVLFQVAGAVVRSVIPVVGLILLFRRSGRAPMVFKVGLSFVIIDGLVRMSVLFVLYPAIAAAFREAGNSLAPLDAARDRQFAEGLREAGYGGIWLVYWLRSTKVARLFTRSEIPYSS